MKEYSYTGTMSIKNKMNFDKYEYTVRPSYFRWGVYELHTNNKAKVIYEADTAEECYAFIDSARKAKAR